MTPLMSVPPPPVPASLSTSGYEDGLGLRTLMFDRETGGILERLQLRPEFGAFERAIRQRMDVGAAFEDERFAHPRSAERDPRSGAVVIVSEFVPGNRLADVLDGLGRDGADDTTPPGVDAALGFLLEILPALATLHASTGFTHGAVGPGRIIVTPAGQVVLLDWIFSHTFERLKLDRRRLWRQFGIAMPPAAGAGRFDAGADVAQAALTAVMIVIGRPIRASEFPDGLAAAAAEVVEIAQISGSARFATGLQRFLHRALPLPGSRLFPTADDADAAVRQLAGEIGVSRCRAALAAFVSEFNRVQELPEREPESAAVRETFDALSDADPSDAAGDGAENARSVSAALEFEIELDSAMESDRPTRDHVAETSPYEISVERVPDDEPVSAFPAMPVSVPTAEAYLEPEPEDAPDPEAAQLAGGDDSALEGDVTAGEPAAGVSEPVATPLPTEACSPQTESTQEYAEASVPAAMFEEPTPGSFADPIPAEADEPAASAVIEQPVHAPASVDDSPPAPPPAPPKAPPTSRQRRRGAKRDRDKLRSHGKPAPAPPPVPTPPPAPVPATAPLAAPAPVRQPAPPMPYYPPMFDPREPAAPAAAAWTLAAPAPVVQTIAAAPIGVKQALAPVAIRVKNDVSSGYGPPARRQELHDSSDNAAVSYRDRGQTPKFSSLQWKLGAAAALLIAVGAGAVARPYLIDRPQPQVSVTPPPVTKVPQKPAAIVAGALTLVTQPAGARVLLDGTPAGETPLTIESVAPGRHVVTFVTAAGAVKKTIRVEAGKTASLDVPVYSGWVAVFAPFLLDIAENGRSIGTTEQGRLMLSPGRHQLTLSNRELGYSSTQSVEIEPGEERSVNVQPTGELNLNALPWAEVWIDGQKVGDTPIANLKVAVGTHEITFKHPQLGDRKLAATVHANLPATASVDFTKTP